MPRRHIRSSDHHGTAPHRTAHRTNVYLGATFKGARDCPTQESANKWQSVLTVTVAIPVRLRNDETIMAPISTLGDRKCHHTEGGKQVVTKYGNGTSVLVHFPDLKLDVMIGHLGIVERAYAAQQGCSRIWQLDYELYVAALFYKLMIDVHHLP